MAKKELTIEEQLGLNGIDLSLINNPSYTFQVGEQVRYGALEESIITEIFYGGKVYGLTCRNKGISSYHIVIWTDIRPFTNMDMSFSKNQEIRLNFLNFTVEGLLTRKYHFGIDQNPDYQRDYVWEQSDKEFLIDSIFCNIEIGKFVFIKLSEESWHTRKLMYEVLDGKQRLQALAEFYENRLSYKGKYYNELSRKDQRTFTDFPVMVADIKEMDKNTVLKYFLMLNRSGKVMDPSHLKKVERMLTGEGLP